MRYNFTLLAVTSVLLGTGTANQVASFADVYDLNDSVCNHPTLFGVDEIQSYLLQNNMCYNLKTTAKQDAKKALYNPAFLPIPDYVMNDEIRNFEPSADAHYLQLGKKEDEVAWIIVGDSSKYTDKHWAVKNGFRDYLSENDLILPDSFLVDDGDDIRYYCVHDEDYKSAYEQMLLYDEMVYDYQIPLYEKFAEDPTDLDRGVVYGLHRDKYHRPIIVWNMYNYVHSDLEIQDLMDTIFMTAYYTTEHAMIPGKVETIVNLLDANNVPVTDMPYTELLKMTMMTKKYLKQRLNYMVVVNLHWALKLAAQMIVSLLPWHISGKIHLYSDNGSEFLNSIVGPEHLEEKYGGYLPNKEDNFWPPQYNP